MSSNVFESLYRSRYIVYFDSQVSSFYDLRVDPGYSRT
jgi:hypothetical protein